MLAPCSYPSFHIFWPRPTRFPHFPTAPPQFSRQQVSPSPSSDGPDRLTDPFSNFPPSCHFPCKIFPTPYFPSFSIPPSLYILLLQAPLHRPNPHSSLLTPHSSLPTPRLHTHLQSSESPTMAASLAVFAILLLAGAAAAQPPSAAPSAAPTGTPSRPSPAPASPPRSPSVSPTPAPASAATPPASSPVPVTISPPSPPSPPPSSPEAPTPGGTAAVPSSSGGVAPSAPPPFGNGATFTTLSRFAVTGSAVIAVAALF